MQRYLVLALVCAAACGGDEITVDVPPECNPLQGGACLAPWPPMTYEKLDDVSITGVKLDIPVGAIPASAASGTPFDPTRINKRSGYSPATQIIAHFGVPLDTSSLAGVGDIAKSVMASSPTVLFEVGQGELVPHIAEVDANVTDLQQDRQALYIRPAARLRAGAWYIVAIKKTLKAADGSDIAVPDGFRAIVEGKTTSNARLEAMREQFDGAIFPMLESQGIAKDDLLLAWQFHTATDDEMRGDLLAARDAAATFQGTGGANLQLSDIVVENNPRAGIAKKVLFRFESPNVRDENGLLRDASGNPEVRGVTTTRGVALVPECATTAAKAPITVFGHGFFGGIEESGGGYLQSFAVRTCRIIIGTDWRGMMRDDSAEVIFALGDLQRGQPFGERIVQGMVDVEALAALAKTKIATQILTDGGGASVADVDAELTYYGISQGSILGSTLYAIDPVMTKAVLHVGGANWSVLFERSTNWAVLGLPFKGNYPDPLLQTMLQQVLQMGLDVIDPIHWAPLAAGPGTARKQYLLHASVGDAQVTNLATFLQVRTMGIPMLTPSVETPFGMTTPTGSPSSAFMIVDESPTPLPPTTNKMNDAGNVAHENARRRAAVMDQIDAFLTDGTITNTCNGACDCATGACGALVDD
ncbi:MAG TPA: hypothetical protein VM261_11655 [Kofleriaceae bacterium]|nr:hypothetical protein [Kofleriaceae bacterium]